MLALELIFVAFLGLILGSFLNVVIVRVPQKKSVVHPRSSCPGCSSAIVWYDNIPVLSYLLLKGRCRKCQTQISFRYPMVELITAILFLAAFHRFGFSVTYFVRDIPWILILVAVTFIDLEHRLIPDVLSLPGLAIGLVTAGLDRELGYLGAVLGAAIGFSVFYGLAWIYLHVAKRSGLGGGDIKLLAMIGAFLGPMGVLMTILISSISGSIIGIAWAAFSKKKKIMQVAIPYGPFLVIGALYYYLIGNLLWSPFTILM